MCSSEKKVKVLSESAVKLQETLDMFKREKGKLKLSLKLALENKRIERQHKSLATVNIIHTDCVQYVLNEKGERVILGKGSYGVVNFARMNFLGNKEHFIAVKHYRSGTKQDDVVKKLRILQTISHPCVLFTIGILDTDIDTCIPSMVTEFIGCEESQSSTTLSNALKMHLLANNSLILIGQQIAEGMQAVHDAGWLHCDLKSNNILLNLTDPENVRAVIIDFGQAVRKGQNIYYWHLSNDKLEETRKRIYWIPDEVVSRQAPYSCKSDVYSYGQIILEMYRILKDSSSHTFAEGI